MKIVETFDGIPELWLEEEQKKRSAKFLIGSGVVATIAFLLLKRRKHPFWRNS